MESASSEEKLWFGNSTLPPRKNTEEGGAGEEEGRDWRDRCVTVGLSQNKHILRTGLYSHVRKWKVSAMAAAKGKKGRRPNIHLLQEELRTGARPPSTSSGSCSSGFVGGLHDWVGSFNSTHPFQRQGLKYHTSFYAQVASNCLHFILK